MMVVDSENYKKVFAWRALCLRDADGIFLRPCALVWKTRFLKFRSKEGRMDGQKCLGKCGSELDEFKNR